MIANRMSHIVSDDNRRQIMEHIAAINTLLPFLVGLKADERKKRLKPGDRDHAFIRKAYEVGPKVEEHLPRSFTMEEFKKDVELMDALYSVMVEVSQLAEKLSDTHAIVSSEAYAAALLVYRNAKDIKEEKGLKKHIAELSRRFAKTSASAEEAGDSGEQAEEAQE